MTIALDMGAKNFRSLERDGRQLIARTRPTACCFLPDKPSVRHLLDDSQVAFDCVGEQLVISGEAAEKLSARCAVKSEHLLLRNPLRKDKTSVAPALTNVIKALLPNPKSSAEICCLSGISDDYHADWLEAEVSARGYRVAYCHSGLAMVLAELIHDNLTGIGLVFGATKSEAVLARDGVELARCEIPRGGVAIDEAIAISEDRYWWSMSGFRELETDTITMWKERRSNSVVAPTCRRGERLLLGCHQLLSELCAACEKTFPEQNLPSELAVIAGGGLTRLVGFEDLLKQHLSESTLPVAVEKTRVESAPYTIARGLLIHAERQSQEPAKAPAA